MEDSSILSAPARDSAALPQRAREQLLLVGEGIDAHMVETAVRNVAHVHVVASADQALKHCQEHAPSLMLVDAAVPNVWVLCRALKSQVATRAISIIALAAADHFVAIDAGLEHGVDDFFATPLYLPLLTRRLNRCLAWHQPAETQRIVSSSASFSAGEEWPTLGPLGEEALFEARLAAEWGRAARNGSTLSVLVAAIDGFDQHRAFHGDRHAERSLQQVATVLSAAIRRPGDLVAYAGGDRFSCVLPETDPGGALERAEWIEQRVRALDLALESNAFDRILTLSAGVATTIASGGDAAPLLALAQSQLAQAQAAGGAQARAAVL